MRRLQAVLLLLCALAGPVRANALDTGTAMATDMMNIMWDFMEWFVDNRDAYRDPYGLSRGYGRPMGRWYFPYSTYGNPWSGNWRNSWLNPQVLDGVWLAPSGEYWLLRGDYFILFTPDGRRFDGRFEREGPFLRVHFPQGMREFEYRLFRDMMVLQDIDGRTVSLRRISGPQWSW